MTIVGTEASIGFSLQYAGYRDDGYTEAFKAEGKAVFSGNPADADTLTIDSVVYRFKNTPAAINDIKIGTTVDDTLLNLLAATRGTSSTGYFAGTKALAKVRATIGTRTLFLVALIPGQAANSLTLAKSSTAITITAFAGGYRGGEVTPAVGVVALNTIPIADDELAVDSTTYIWKASPSLATHIAIGANRFAAAANLAAKLASNASVTSIAYTSGESVVSWQAATPGSAGNALALTTTGLAAAITLSGSTFLGGTDARVYVRSSHSFKRMAARDIDYGSMQIAQMIPLEVGPDITPKGPYKSGVAMTGGFSFHPRLQDDIGVLLLAAMGACSTVVNGTVGTHTFKYASQSTYLPWLTVRKSVPGKPGVRGMGETGWDNKIGRLQIAMPTAAPVEAAVEFTGRVPELDDRPEAWESDSYEDFKGIPITCNGFFKIPAFSDNRLPVTQVVIEVLNDLTDIRREQVIGSHFGDDVVVLQRALQLRFLFKWNNPDLYRQIYNLGGSTGTWDPTPYVTETSGGDYACQAVMQSPYKIPGSTTNYGLEVRGNHVSWQAAGPMQIQAGNIVTQPYVGTFLTPNAGNYAEVILTNENTTGYTVPAEPA